MDFAAAQESERTPLRDLCRFSMSLDANTLKAASKAAPPGAWSVATESGRTPLHDLCRHNTGLNAGVLKVASKAAGPSAWSVTDEYGSTPLLALCRNPGLKAEVLTAASKLAGGPEAWSVARIDVQMRMWTPLHDLCSNRAVSSEVLRAANEAADPDAWKMADKDGRTPLHDLCVNPAVTPEILATYTEVLAAVGALNETADETSVAVRLLCTHMHTTSELLDAVAAASGTTLLRCDVKGESVLEAIFRRYAPDGAGALPTVTYQISHTGKQREPLDWLTHEGLWARIPGSPGYVDWNPLALATRLKKIAWVEAIIGVLAEKTGDEMTAFRHDILHLAPGLRFNIFALFKMQLGDQAVQLLKVCVRVVPGSVGIPEITPLALKFEGASERSHIEQHDAAAEDWVEGKHGVGAKVFIKDGRRRATVVEHDTDWGFLKVRVADDGSTKRVDIKEISVMGAAPAWGRLAAAASKDKFAADGFFPRKPLTLVHAEPVMLAIDGAPANDGNSLLHTLLYYTENEKHNEVFSTELVTSLIAFKWQRCAFAGGASYSTINRCTYPPFVCLCTADTDKPGSSTKR
jgi:hypothetical protein